MAGTGCPGKKTNSSHKTRKTFKQQRRAAFEGRHVDQVWQDVRKPAGTVHDGSCGPSGTTTKAELSEDLPATGKYYCVPCSRYFISAAAQVTHEGTKPHKRKLKMLLTTSKPHSQADADNAKGMGSVDNGPRLRSAGGLPAPMQVELAP